MSNAQTVMGIYEAFGRGDVPAILAQLDPDVRWEYWEHGNGAQSGGVPWLAERRGAGDVAGFFESLGAVEIHHFEPFATLEGENRIVALIEIDLEVKSTGRRFQDEELHLWTFGPDGKVVKFQHFVDTAKHLAAVGTPAAVG